MEAMHYINDYGKNSNNFSEIPHILRNVKFVTLGYNSEGKKVKTDIKPEGYEKEYVTDTRKKIKDMVFFSQRTNLKSAWRR